jgi:hypothetical protein
MPTADNKSDITKPLSAPESSLDTGTGGFNIDDKVQTFDVGIVTDKQPTATYSPGSVTANAGFIGPDSKPLDISHATKTTLAQYLSNLTNGKVGIGSKSDAFQRRPNAYPIGGSTDTSAYKEISITGPNGATPSLGTYSPDGNFSSESSGGGFAPGNTGPAMRTLSKDAVTLDKFVRGGSKGDVLGPGEATGHGLLRSATDQENFDNAFAVDVTGKFKTTLSESMPAGAYTTALLNNRFTNQQPMSGKPEAYYENSVINTEGMNHKQFVHGYTKGVSAIPEAARKFSMGQLAQVGTILGIRASGENNANETMTTAGMTIEETTAALPGVAQLAVTKIRMGLLEAKDVFDSLKDDSAIQNSQLVSIGSESNESASWGVLNNALDQYSGASNFGMMLLSAALIIATTVVIAGFSEIIVLIEKNFDVGGKGSSSGKGGSNDVTMSSIYTDSQQRRYIGTSSRRSKSGGVDVKALLNIARTNSDYFLCIRTGVFAFFGLGDFTSGSEVLTVGRNALLDSITAPEHPVVQARAFLRSFLVIADSMKSVVSAFKSNPLAGSKQILNFTNVLIHSKFLGALNTFAVLGDAVLSFSDDDDIDKVASDGGFGRKISRMDYKTNEDAHSKNRLKDSIRLAWSSYRSPDMLLQSTLKPYALSAQNLPRERGTKFSAERADPFLNSYCVPKDNGNRISDEIREAVEASLDSEYLPFYFHDLRTNEILSFHAFLSTIGESYAVAYEAAEGFGRVDPVKIYKNTRRKIDFSFYVVATSSEDFDSMWTKINKLTTLLYPQYTPGKKVDTVLDDVNYKFYAPFSQLMSASPMIRLRIGDLITNNYSRFNLARMFGYGTTDTKFAPTITESAAATAAMHEELARQRKKLSLLPHRTYIYEFDNSAFQLWGWGGETDYAGNSKRDAIDNFIKLGGCFKLNDTSYDPQKNALADENGNATITDYGQLLFRPFVDLEGDQIQYPMKLWKAHAILLEQIDPEADGMVRIPFSYMRLTKTSMKKIAKSAHQIVNEENPAWRKIITDKHQERDGIVDFMNENTNAVSRSFKTVGGKGVAGFIDSLSFDWHEKVTWAGAGDKPGISRAPKMCKITISYSPIHDISPGLDHKGLNRAPIYQVGPMSREDKI